MPDVFAEFCAAGLWPGIGQAMSAKLAEAGITSPADVTAPNLSGLPRMTDRRASRLVTSFIGAGQLYQIAELLVPEEIPVRWAARLAEALGDEAGAVLRADPWRLLALPDGAAVTGRRRSAAVRGGRAAGVGRRAGLRWRGSGGRSGRLGGAVDRPRSVGAGRVHRRRGVGPAGQDGVNAGR